MLDKETDMTDWLEIIGDIALIIAGIGVILCVFILVVVIFMCDAPLVVKVFFCTVLLSLEIALIVMVIGWVRNGV